MQLFPENIGFVSVRNALGWIVVAGFLLLQSGCQATNDRSANDEIYVTEPSCVIPPIRSSELIAGRSHEGRLIHCFIFGDPSISNECVLLIASIHGSEPAGTPLLELLIDLIDRGDVMIPATTTILIMPNVNPDGVANGSRRNMRGVDLNRNFPTTNWIAYKDHGITPMSEPETAALIRVIEDFQPTRLVSIHQPIACIDFDGPLSETRQLAYLMSESCNSEYRLPVKQLGARSGSLGSWAGNERGIPTITLELPNGVEDLAINVLWDRYGKMLLTAGNCKIIQQQQSLN